MVYHQLSKIPKGTWKYFKLFNSLGALQWLFNRCEITKKEYWLFVILNDFEYEELNFLFQAPSKTTEQLERMERLIYDDEKYNYFFLNKPLVYSRLLVKGTGIQVYQSFPEDMPFTVEIKDPKKDFYVDYGSYGSNINYVWDFNKTKEENFNTIERFNYIEYYKKRKRGFDFRIDQHVRKGAALAQAEYKHTPKL